MTEPLQILLVCDELMTRTRLAGAWKAAGAEVHTRRDAPGAALIVLDLAARDALAALPALRAAHPRAPVIAFGAHVDGPAFAAARAAGVDEVVARGAVVERVQRRLRAGH